MSSPDWRLIVIDETEYWNLPEYPGVRVESVYLFNAAEHVYCCELRPSYWLVPVETRGILPEETDTEERREALSEVISAHAGWDGHYRHVSSVRLDATRAVGWTPDPDATPEEDAEAVEEYCQCNSLA